MDPFTADHRAGAEPARWAGDRYVASLVLLLITVLVFAVAEDNPVGRVTAVAAHGVTLLVILWTSAVRRRVLIGSAVVAGLAVVASAIVMATSQTGAHWGLPAMAALLVLLAPVAITQRLLAHPSIGLGTVMGALCLYVLGGLFFAAVYRALDLFAGGGFFVQMASARSVDFVYFSFVTLATLGYGDLTPAADLGRMLAITQTMLGQLYLVGIVAVLVSNLGRARGPRRHPAA